MPKLCIVSYSLMREICSHLEKNRKHFRGKLDIVENEGSSEKSDSAKQVKRLLLSAKRKKKEQETKRRRKKQERDECKERFRQGTFANEDESEGDSDGNASDSSVSSGSFKTDSDSDERITDSGDDSAGKTGETLH